MDKKENNLKTYLKEQMEEYREECDSMKALYADLLEHIEDCREQIRQQKAKEDTGFALLSPLADEISENTMVVRLESQIETYEKQKSKYQQEIRFYEEKTKEMQDQLDEFERNETLKAEWEKREENQNADLLAAVKLVEAENVTALENGLSRNSETAEQHKDQIFEGPEDRNVRSAYNIEENLAAYAQIARKLTEIKRYVQVDPRRAAVEIEHLTAYVNTCISKLRDGKDSRGE